MRARSARLFWGITCVLAALLGGGDARGGSTSNVLERTLAFPTPVQWKVGGAEISLIGLAWGPAISPEMQAKGREKTSSEKPEFLQDRPYVLALRFQAKLPTVVSTEQYSSSGLALVKNVDGEFEPPVQLTPSGFTRFSDSPGVYDVHFNRSGTTEFWDLFPASADQKEFLFQVIGGSAPMSRRGPCIFSFKIVLQDGDFAIVNTVPRAQMPCSKFKKNLAGTIGARSKITVQLIRGGEMLSGTEQYARIGQTLWLQGTADSLGNFLIEERYPKDRVTGVFKGKLSENCQVLTGYFSKPDGSRLQPFELREIGAADPVETGDSSSEQR
jgi:hypothetical protein